jgi:hypothetical protein
MKQMKRLLIYVLIVLPQALVAQETFDLPTYTAPAGGRRM